ncbi:hypothetical protein ACFOUO_16065 [Salinithrix halophila]|uniref:Uncharacterized protein n=1 Tax=Salinithrix halophila TaxID=1485204 RepID=A0ABV8JQR3_9BACL
MGSFLIVFMWSAIHPYDPFTWVLEVLPAVFAVILLGLTVRTFPLTPLVYGVIGVHAMILLVGGHNGILSL